MTRITLHDGFEGETEEGLELQSDRDEVEAAFGPVAPDPFAGMLWYRDRGVAFGLTDDRVTSVHLFPIQVTTEPR